MGDMNLAKEMIVSASLSGADYAKFQIFEANKLAIKKSNAIDGSVYYFNVDVIHNKLDVNNFSGTILSIDLNPLKKKYDNPRKFNDFLMNLFRASRNILS